MEIVVEPVAAPTDEARALVAELDATLGAAYEPHQRHGLSFERLFRPDIRFFLARLDGAAVGCGGIAFFVDYAEVKRMYTRAAARRQGVGRTLLARIEAGALRAGLGILRLETGIHQPAAIALYEGSGFRRRDAFGQYAKLPPDRIAASLFYQKAV